MIKTKQSSMLENKSSSKNEFKPISRVTKQGVLCSILKIRWRKTFPKEKTAECIKRLSLKNIQLKSKITRDQIAKKKKNLCKSKIKLHVKKSKQPSFHTQDRAWRFKPVYKRLKIDSFWHAFGGDKTKLDFFEMKRKIKHIMQSTR